MKVFCILLLLYIIWQYWELQKFKVTHYEIETDRIKKNMKIAVIADMHSHEYGRDNKRLIDEIRKQQPDLILIPGDMIVSIHTEDYAKSLHFFEEISSVAPIYFSNGNHESCVDIPESKYYDTYTAYKQKLQQLGVHFRNNRTVSILWGGDKIAVSGVDIPLECYHKGKQVPLPEGYMKQTLGEKPGDRFTILLAHNPAFTEEYAAWGADLIVSGHTHGGLIRIPGVGSLISPQFEFFPKYDAGRFDLGNSTAIISKGLGTHTFHIRIFDRAELVMIEMKTSDCGIAHKKH